MHALVGLLCIKYQSAHTAFEVHIVSPIPKIRLGGFLKRVT